MELEETLHTILAEEFEKRNEIAAAMALRTCTTPPSVGMVAAVAAMARIARGDHQSLLYQGADAADAPDAVAATESGDLLAEVTKVIRMAYIGHTTQTKRAMETAEKVLVAVQAFYERAAAAEGLLTKQ